MSRPEHTTLLGEFSYIVSELNRRYPGKMTQLDHDQYYKMFMAGGGFVLSRLALDALSNDDNSAVFESLWAEFSTVADKLHAER